MLPLGLLVLPFALPYVPVLRRFYFGPPFLLFPQPVPSSWGNKPTVGVS